MAVTRDMGILIVFGGGTTGTGKGLVIQILIKKALMKHTASGRILGSLVLMVMIIKSNVGLCVPRFLRLIR